MVVVVPVRRRKRRQGRCSGRMQLSVAGDDAVGGTKRWESGGRGGEEPVNEGTDGVVEGGGWWWRVGCSGEVVCVQQVSRWFSGN